MHVLAGLNQLSNTSGKSVGFFVWLSFSCYGLNVYCNFEILDCILLTLSVCTSFPDQPIIHPCIQSSNN